MCCKSRQKGRTGNALFFGAFSITSVMCHFFETFSTFPKIKKRKNFSCRNKQKSHLVIFTLVWDFEGIHGLDHGLHCCKYILVHQFCKAPFVFIRVTWSMNDSHLLDKCAFATLSCACKTNKKDMLYPGDTNMTFFAQCWQLAYCRAQQRQVVLGR